MRIQATRPLFAWGQLADYCQAAPDSITEDGLRLEEGLNLQLGDVDARRGLVHVHRGKGAKDRYIPLPSSTLQWLRR